MIEELVEACSFLLKNLPAAAPYREYLYSRLSESSTDKFNFGYLPPLKELSHLTSLVSHSTLQNLGIMKFSKTGEFSYFEDHNCIMPYRNPYGEMVGLVGRTILPESEYKAKFIPKYKNSSENPQFKKGNLLFGLYENKNEIIKKDCVFVVEGQMDVIKANEKGFNNIVGLGSANMTAYQFSIMTRYTENVYLLLDNDEAGEKGRRRIMDKFGSNANIKNYYVPEPYKDIDEFFHYHDYKDLRFDGCAL